MYVPSGLSTKRYQAADFGPRASQTQPQPPGIIALRSLDACPSLGVHEHSLHTLLEIQSRIVFVTADHLKMQAVRSLGGQLRQHGAARIGFHGKDVAFHRIYTFDLLLLRTARVDPRKRPFLV